MEGRVTQGHKYHRGLHMVACSHEAALVCQLINGVHRTDTVGVILT